MTASEEQLVGHSYTRARKYPLVIGKLPGAGRLPGGPYTITQVVTMVAVFGVLVLSRRVWARFGVADAAVMVIAPWGLAWVLRYARIDGRDPARALRSLLSYLGAPAGGRLAGRSVRPGRAGLLLGGACTIHVRTTSFRARPAPEASGVTPEPTRPAQRLTRPPGGHAVEAPSLPRTQVQELLATFPSR